MSACFMHFMPQQSLGSQSRTLSDWETFTAKHTPEMDTKMDTAFVILHHVLVP